jgi:predicted small metal-binding protein
MFVLLRELICPACGAIIEAAEIDELVVACKRHTREQHGYELPAEHVVMSLLERRAASHPIEASRP